MGPQRNFIGCGAKVGPEFRGGMDGDGVGRTTRISLLLLVKAGPDHVAAIFR